ncbi:unnamed protein product [Mucor hiemalis]
MIATKQSCKSLPLEVLLKVFQSATKTNLREYALVCKAWLNPVQSMLYSDVKISTLLQLENYCDAVQNNPLLGELVKVFRSDNRLRWGTEETDKIAKLLSTLFNDGLPNLQEVKENALRTHDQILSALQNSRLKKLKVLNSLDSYGDVSAKKNYRSCILLMHDRVEKVLLRPMSDSTPDCIYNKLDEFNTLKEISIAGYVSWFQTVEYVTASCKNLKALAFNFTGQMDHVDVDIDAIVPSRNIESLTAQISDNNMLLYTMRKFPQPRELTLLHFFNYVPDQPEELTRILAYASGIDTLKIGTFSVDSSISDFTANYWELASAELGSRTVETCYYDSCDEEYYGLDIFKPKGAAEATFSYMYHIWQFNSQHIEVINKLGKYIGEFHFKYEADSDVYNSPKRRDLPSKFMDHLFKRCPDLHTLHFTGWVFRKCNILRQKLPFGELYFKECIIYGGYLNRLSPILPHLNRLVFEKNAYIAGNKQTKSNYEYEYGFNNVLEIYMPQTQVGTIVFIQPYRERTSPSYIKIFAASENTYHYYGYKKEDYFVANEKDFNKAKGDGCIHIRCMNTPKIQIKDKSDSHGWYLRK